MQRDSMIGNLVSGRFRIVEHLGEGSVGDIYLAEHNVLSRQYALKVLKRRFMSNQTVAERFRREALVASRLEHPNIVEISDFGRAENGRLFLAMELIKGRSLGATIDEYHPGVMPLRRALIILQQVASAVAAAHDAGVLHRDLKPDNIMLDTSRPGAEIVKILDFGLAKVMVDAESLVLTKRGEMFGTPMYMSPEQARGETVDSRTDIYAFGAIAYDICTGRPPFVSDRLDELLIATQIKIPAPPSKVQPMGSAPIPPELDLIILQCLAKDQDERPLRISEIAAVLDKCLASFPSRGSPYLSTVEYEKVDLEALESELAGVNTTPQERAVAKGRASQLESIMDASIVEIDPWQWRKVCRLLVSLAQQLKGERLCPLEVVSLLASLGDVAERLQRLETELEVPTQRLSVLESASREHAAQLRHAVIDLSLERGRVAEDPDGDPQRMVDLDFQIKELEERLAQVYRTSRDGRAEPEREVAELEQQLDQVRQQQTELEFKLLDSLRASRPEPAPPDIEASYKELEKLLQGVS
ncbi:MAG: serine/threonine-protein kinase [bacterium]